MLAKTPPCEHCAVRQYSIFKDCLPEELVLLNDNKSCTFYKKGQNIFYAGQRPMGLFHLHSGKVKVYKTGKNGKEKIVRLASPGDILGYRALLGDDEYNATAATMEDSTVCCIDKETFNRVLGENPHLRMKVMQFLCRELCNAEIRMMNLMQKSVRERLAETLLTLKEKYGTTEDNDREINIILPMKDLANLVGVARETVMRTMIDFRTEKLIAVEGHRVRILDLEALERIGNMYEN